MNDNQGSQGVEMSIELGEHMVWLQTCFPAGGVANQERVPRLGGGREGWVRVSSVMQGLSGGCGR